MPHGLIHFGLAWFTLSMAVGICTAAAAAGSVDADSDADDGSDSDGEKSGDERTAGVNRSKKRMEGLS